ncbi:MAG: hypothetical protein FWC40_09165 [Proteobacteria bacterium]|nr:hypothetical protein [Pseudomonadota bacterium]
MYELFVMSLKEYWKDQDESEQDVTQSIQELQDVLSDHFQKEVRWSEPDVKSEEDETEIEVDVVDDLQLSSLHAVAAKLELDGNLDGLELPADEPWECDVFERLSETLEEKESDIEKFCHILSIGNSSTCFIVPVDLPFVAQINVGDKEETEDDCDCDCEEDDGSVDIASLPGIRRELDTIAAALKLDTSLSLDECESIDFDDEDNLRHAKMGWYIFSHRVNDAIKAELPLILNFVDDEFDDMDDDEDEE